MRRFPFLLASCVLAVSLCHANPVGEKRAEAVARRVLGGDVVHRGHEAFIKTRGESPAQPSYYVFNRSEGQGFVIVSGEDELPEVVAYSDDASFSTDDIHPALGEFLDSYTQMVAELRSGETEIADRRSMDEAVPVVEPLCTTSWSQAEPYNALCPMDGTKRSLVGCVATAMAQIMKHHSWPERGNGKVQYATSLAGVGVLSVDFSQATYNWDAMFNTAEENKADEAAAAEVAKICYHCGVSSRMDYGSSASSTYDDYAIQSMYENFGYKASTIRIVYRNCCETQEEWDRIWKRELDAGRPVLYGGVTTSGGGHEFIVDGYDSNGFVHVNWGWGGLSNGYFDIAVLDATASQRFSEAQVMIIGIEPDYTGNDNMAATVVPYIDSRFSLTGSVGLGKDKLVMLSNVYNRSRSGQTWYVGFGLYDFSGNLVANVTASDVYKTIAAMMGLKSINAKFNIPADMPEGDYILSSIFRSKNSDTWNLPNVVGGAVNNKVFVTVKDGKATFGQLPTGVSSPAEDRATVVSNEYYDLSGRRLLSPLGCGVVIERQTMSNGECVVRKRLFARP